MTMQEWTVNQQQVNNYKDWKSASDLIKQFNDNELEFEEDLKKAFGGNQVINLDVREELNELLKVYANTEQHLKINEDYLLNSLTACMKRYLEAQEERKKIIDKINSINEKLASIIHFQSFEDEDEDE